MGDESKPMDAAGQISDSGGSPVQAAQLRHEAIAGIAVDKRGPAAVIQAAEDYNRGVQAADVVRSDISMLEETRSRRQSAPGLWGSAKRYVAGWGQDDLERQRLDDLYKSRGQLERQVTDLANSANDVLGTAAVAEYEEREAAGLHLEGDDLDWLVGIIHNDPEEVTLPDGLREIAEINRANEEEHGVNRLSPREPSIVAELAHYRAAIEHAVQVTAQLSGHPEVTVDAIAELSDRGTTNLTTVQVEFFRQLNTTLANMRITQGNALYEIRLPSDRVHRGSIEATDEQLLAMMLSHHIRLADEVAEMAEASRPMETEVQTSDKVVVLVPVGFAAESKRNTRLVAYLRQVSEAAMVPVITTKGKSEIPLVRIVDEGIDDADISDERRMKVDLNDPVVFRFVNELFWQLPKSRYDRAMVLREGARLYWRALVAFARARALEDLQQMGR